MHADPRDGERPALGQLRPVANRCASGSCPTIFVSDATGTLVVQGLAVPAERVGIDLPAGEMLVEIPAELLREAVRHLT